MFENSNEWNKDTLRALRLRLGWSRSDMARRLKCELTEIESWEEGQGELLFNSHIKGELALIHRQADECSDQVRFTPACENECDKQALDQVDFSRVKADLE
ncbi:helix-turn-helix transcriptional regulator [Bdellovibrio sp. KM01]|uniref:helix-turn-helix transcriptional regulator n=1 Tax=Bdellovibrio sp. KM01 TaxID=2748865 RepID=UPI0015EA0336|nr:helix-turn-helix transcriptional regulator [Bdellovibrio sp. KM01]QLY24793.1 helix-turn-helix domain-containing protein [Bdellovibrio sp. KM01]